MTEDNTTINSTKFKEKEHKRLLILEEVKAVACLSKSTIYRKIYDGTFPRPVRLSTNRVAWSSTDINNWLETLPESGGLTNG